MGAGLVKQAKSHKLHVEKHREQAMPFSKLDVGKLGIYFIVILERNNNDVEREK
jgi:hypothetical protein